LEKRPIRVGVHWGGAQKTRKSPQRGWGPPQPKKNKEKKPPRIDPGLPDRPRPLMASTALLVFPARLTHPAQTCPSEATNFASRPSWRYSGLMSRSAACSNAGAIGRHARRHHRVCPSQAYGQRYEDITHSQATLSNSDKGVALSSGHPRPASRRNRCAAWPKRAGCHPRNPNHASRARTRGHTAAPSPPRPL